jgi:hypothetical protein
MALVEKTLSMIGELVKMEVLKRDDFIAFLRKHRLDVATESNFEGTYVEALAMRRLAGLPAPVLSLFRKDEISDAFQEAWRTGVLDQLNKEARRAVEMFREGDEMRSLGIDVVAEVQHVFEVFGQLVSRRLSPGDQLIARKLEELSQGSSRISLPPSSVSLTSAERFCRDIKDWFAACGATPVTQEEWVEKDHSFDIMLSVGNDLLGRRTVHLRGVDGDVRSGDLRELLKTRRDAEATWLIARTSVSPGARQLAVDNRTAVQHVLSFDEVVDSSVTFANYEAQLTRDITSRGVDRFYVPLHCRRPEPDRSGAVILEQGSRYDSLEEYIEKWLQEDLREHVSILGEFGTGKSWFCLHLASEYLERYRGARRLSRPRGRYPLLIQLRDYAKAMSADALLSHFFFDRYSTRLPSMDAFRVLNRMGRFLLILDGFDEMAQKVDYQKVVNNFWELAHRV